MAYQHVGALNLGFGKGKDQYQLFDYPGPEDDETMGIFFEWHTGDYFDVDSSPHIAIGLRGPVKEDPHRGRGLAIGILASHMSDPEDPSATIPLFVGCPPPPGGPSFFIEDFTINEGIAPIEQWQFSPGQNLPELLGNRTYRIDIHVSKGQVWAGVWQRSNQIAGESSDGAIYKFLGQTACTNDIAAYSGDPAQPCPEDKEDQGVGNAFIGTGFSDPETNSWIDNIYIAHWIG